MIKLVLGVFKIAKLGKFSITLASMVFSLAVYAMIYGWRYAGGFIALLLLHEAGHYIAAQQRGLDVGAPTFIPFVGAWIELKERPMDAETEAYVAMAGPLVGTVGAFAFYAIGRDQGDKTMLAIAYAGYFLNFFNLIPLSPLDGGRITAILSPRVWFAGVPALILAFIFRPSALLVMIGIAAIPALKMAWHYNPDDAEHAKYYNVSLRTKAEYGALYIGLAAYLSVMTQEIHALLGQI